MARELILGYDDSACSQAALETAVELAQRFGDKLVVIFAYRPPTNVGEEYKEHMRALEEMGERATKHAIELASKAGVQPEVVLAPEHPVEALLIAARERDARMIVVGTYGDSPLKGAILGSTPHKLLHLSDLPVVVVPEPGGA